MSNTGVPDIAVIGMACRFPGAANPERFWRNLQAGVESISFFSDQELLAAGVPADALRDLHYVKAGAYLPDIDLFDAVAFGFNPREAEMLDVQQRLFFECAWEVLERAGYDTDRYPGLIGVYAGAGMNTYLINNLLPNRRRLEAVGVLQAKLGNEKDYLASRTSYKLNLKGPSINVQSACSTSLVAIHLACQALINGECDMALAGGVSVMVPQKTGYVYEPGGIASPDGHCRAFDARAQGTVSGNGAGVVMLKLAADAEADGDQVYALVRGSAINNDGALKAGFTAPSVEGQAAVIAEALAIAGVEPETIQYVETHGSGTALGDVIEIEALQQAFASRKTAFCAIGSVKTNVGHLDAAAGIAGFIKTVLALHHKQLPPSLNFDQPNPQIDFAASPFYVQTVLSPWPATSGPCRAGVSSFGIGGTNAHVVLEEAVASAPDAPSRPWHLLPLSARTPSALKTATDQLARYLQHHPNTNVADVVYTLQLGRRSFEHRYFVVSQTHDEAAAALNARDAKQVFTSAPASGEPAVAFLFPGLGDHYVGMAQGLYDSQPLFRDHFDQCCDILTPLLELDPHALVFTSEPAPPQSETAPLDFKRLLQTKPDDPATRRLNQTVYTQPVMFAVEYALARLWMDCGVTPQAILGYSIGEYVAACLAGVFSLQDALFLVAKRAQLIQALPAGAMLAVLAGEDDLAPWLGPEVSLSAVNSPTLCVCSGPSQAIADLEAELGLRKIISRRLQTSHAFHSQMMAPLSEALAKLVASVVRRPPQLPYLSNVTGTWITTEQAMEPDYWVQHTCQAVRFADGVGELLRVPRRVLLEIGPGQSLGSFALQHPAMAEAPDCIVLPTLRNASERQPDAAFFLQTLGKLWLSGVGIDWASYYAQEQRRRILLPTYPFERKRHWIDAPSAPAPPASGWFSVPLWRQTAPRAQLAGPTSLDGSTRGWLLFSDALGLATQLRERLASSTGQPVVTVTAAQDFTQQDEFSYTLNPSRVDDYDALFEQLRRHGGLPTQIVHLFGLVPSRNASHAADGCHDLAPGDLERGFYSLLYVEQALSKQRLLDTATLWVISNSSQGLAGECSIRPANAMLMGLSEALSSTIACRGIDVTISDNTLALVTEQLLREFTTPSAVPLIAYRGRTRWEQAHRPVSECLSQETRLRGGGTYLIIGDLEATGLGFAAYLASQVQAKLVLIDPYEQSSRPHWDERLASIVSLGADVVYQPVNCDHGPEMSQAIAVAIDRGSGIDGVIYAPGTSTDTNPVSLVGPDGPTMTEQLDAIAAVVRALAGQPLNFGLLVAPAPGRGDSRYAVAGVRAFMAAVAYEQRENRNAPWVSVDLDREDDADLSAEVLLDAVGAGRILECVLSLDGLSRLVVKGAAATALELQVDATAQAAAEQARNGHLYTSHLAPVGPVEDFIAATWQALMGIASIGRHDHFFNLGGHSLLGIRVIARIRERFQLELPLRALFECPTVSELALAIEEAVLAEVEALPEEDVKRLVEW